MSFCRSYVFFSVHREGSNNNGNSLSDHKGVQEEKTA